MESNSKLDELKKQVRDISNQQVLIQRQRDRKQEMASYLGQEQEQNQQEMMQLIHNVLGQNELVTVREREKLQDKLDAFSHKQTVMNEQLITLNDNLTDTAALKAVYEAKREELDLDYQNLKNKYDRIISNKKTELAEIEHECKSLKTKYRNLKIKRIVRYTLIAAIILLILAFAIRWGTLLRNQISSNEQKSEQVGQTSIETEKADTDKNRGFLEWLLPADE